MKSRLRRICGGGILLLALGCGISARGRQSGPMAAAPAMQDTAQNPPAQSSAAQVTPTTATTPARGAKIEVPSGTHIPLVLHNAISTRGTRPGDAVYLETLFPVMVDGKVVIPAGSYVNGEVTQSKRPGRVKGRGELMIKLKTLILPNAYMVNLAAAPNNAGTGGGETVNSEGQVIGDTDKGSDAGTVIKSTGAATGIGAIAGGAKGAGIGAGIGAAVGLGAILLTRGPEAELPRGTTLEAVLDRPIFLDADKVHFTSPGRASTLAGPPNRGPQRSKVPF